MTTKKTVVGEEFAKYKLLSLTKQGVIPRDLEEAKGKFPESFETYQVVEPGDLIFCLFDIDETPRTIGIVQELGMVTGAYTRFNCDNETTRDFAYLLYRSVDDQKALKPLYTGLRKVVNKESFLSAKIALPPLDEQAAIVRYLDEADKQIQAYTSAKERLIALLEEQRQAIIHQAVTRGLDPNVKLKPSGVEWLGDVPEHWEVLRARFLFKEIDERSATGEETHLSMSQKLGLVPSNLVEQSLISESYIGAKICQKGDLVLNRLKAHLGVFALATQTGIVSSDYSIFRNRRLGHMQYFESTLRLPSLKTELKSRTKGIVEGFWRLYSPEFFGIRLPVPPAAEQHEIVAHLNKVSIQFEKAISDARRQIELMEEYRTRLIADVVTGKLDVRGTSLQNNDMQQDI